MSKRIWIIVPFFVYGLACFGQPKVLPTQQAAIEQLFADWYSLSSPGCQVAVFQQGRVIYQKSFGMADLERQIPIGPSTVFSIESISKQFTAACIFLLEDQGKLRLSDPLSQYFPELPAYAAHIQLSDLIYHTSGLRDFFKLAHLTGLTDSSDFLNQQEVFELIARQKTLNFSSGTQYLYNNSGYFLLANLVERVSGQSLRLFAQTNIFQPLGMGDTFFNDGSAPEIADRAWGYEATPSGWKKSDALMAIVGDGGLMTTVRDLAKWDANFYHNQLKISSFKDKMCQAGRLRNGELLAYGAGLDLITLNGHSVVGHSGAYKGYRSAYFQFPDQQFSIVVLGNANTLEPRRMAEQVADILLIGAKPPIAKPYYASGPSLVNEKLLGMYEIGNGDLVHIYLKNKQLIADIIGQVELLLIPQTESDFAVKGTDLTFTFPVDMDGNVRHLVYGLNERKCVARRLPAPQRFSDAVLKEYEGAYFNEELNVRYLIFADHGQLYLRIGDQPKIPISLVGIDKMVMPDCTATFQRDQEGSVAAFSVQAGEVRGICFTKK